MLTIISPYTDLQADLLTAVATCRRRQHLQMRQTATLFICFICLAGWLVGVGTSTQIDHFVTGCPGR